MTRAPRLAGSTFVLSALKRPGALRRLAGVILFCEGVLAVNVALDNGAPPLLIAVAVVAILTGIGVYRQVDAATAIGLMLAGLLIFIDVTSLPAAIGEGASVPLAGVVAELLANLVVVYALLRRPSPGPTGPGPNATGTSPRI